MGHIEVSKKQSANATEMLNTLLSIGADEIVENTLHKVINYQLVKYRIHIDLMKREIEPFEKKYKMTSEDFYREFESGKLGDDGDFFEWSGLYENLLLFEKRVKEREALENEGLE